MTIEAIHASVGPRWPQILPGYGLDAAVLDGRHHPCPVCGGRDRFRFIGGDGGKFWCSNCRSATNGIGDALDLIAGATGWSLGDTIKTVAGDLGIALTRSEGREGPSKERRALDALWNSSKPAAGQPLVERYLRGRGLNVPTPPELRFHPWVFEPETKMKMPAILAPIKRHDGRLVSIHRTYLALDGRKADIQSAKKVMPPDGTITGAGIPLFNRQEDCVAVAEGVETALAVVQRYGTIPIVASVSSGGMKSLQLPEHITKVAIYGDNDSNFAGQAAAYALAERMAKAGKRVYGPYIPAEVGDWLDVLTGKIHGKVEL